MNYFKVRLEKRVNRKVLAIFALVALVGILMIVAYAVDASGYFSDVDDSDWYYDEVEYVYEAGLMQGISDETFNPEGNVSRGMIVTILWRLENEPSASDNSFDDVALDQYFTQAISWANTNDIVNGYGDGRFGPNDYITREQLAVILYRYADYKGYEVSQQADISEYEDADGISSYATTAFSWAVSNGFISGMTSTTLNPTGYTNRAQAAVVLQRFCESDIELVESSPVEDVETDEETVLDSEESVEEALTEEAATDKEIIDDGTPIIYVKDVSVAAGTTEIEVPVLIQNNPGILGMILTISYDESALILKDTDNGEAISNVLTLTNGNELVSGCRFLWDGLEISAGDVYDGEILLLTFKVIDNAASGKYGISFAYEAGDIIDNNLMNISPSIYEGYVTIN